MKHFHLFILLWAIVQCAGAQTVADSLTRELTALAEQSAIVGFGVAVYDQDQVLYRAGFGYADQATQRPYTIHTVQKVASLSKTFLGVALMKAQALGFLDLDDPAQNYLPFPLQNPFHPDATITIRHLATHTAGLKKTKRDFQALYFPEKIPPIHRSMPHGLRRLLSKKIRKTLNQNAHLSMEKFLHEIYHPEGSWYKKGNFSRARPGEKVIYSNNGAAFLGLILARATGMPYADFLRQHIFEPLKMQHTAFDFEAVVDAFPDRSSLYHAGQPLPANYELISYPAGGIETNVLDYSNYMSAMVRGYQQGNALLAHQDFLNMMTTQGNPEFEQGILWKVHTKSIGHNGDLAGVTCYSYFYKEKGIGYLLFCNTALTKNIDAETSAIIRTLKSYYTRLQTAAR